MSLTTRCPACDTNFKIVPDQLKASKGWVRCGRCAEVFDTAAHAAAPDDANPWPQTSLPEAFVQSNATIAKNTENTPKNIAAEEINTPVIANLPPISEKFDADLAFVRTAKNKIFWQQESVVALLRTGCVGLVGLLFFQVVLSQRNYIAATSPALGSIFESVCHVVGCKIEPFRNIDAFKIDNSSFQKVPAVSYDPTLADVFTLKITLKNNSDLPLAMPAIELTLTDAGDKPVVRRVLLAKDLGLTADTLTANGDLSGTATIAVAPNPAAAPVSGYRVLLFYP